MRVYRSHCSLFALTTQLVTESSLMSATEHHGFGASLEQLPWRQLAPGLREKAYETQTQRFRLVEFAESFQEPDWCDKGHAGYVLSGAIVVNMNGTEVTFGKGDAVNIPAGVLHRHVATIEIATLFLVENVDT